MRQSLTTFLVMTLVAASFLGNLTSTLGTSSTTVVLNAQFDNYVSENNPGSCYGREVVLNVRSYSKGEDHFNQRTYISFDVSVLPENATVVSALLWLYKNPEGANPRVRNIQVFRVTGAWSEYTLNWNNQPDFSSEPSTVTHVGGPLKWYVWDLTQDVNAWQRGSAINHGMMLKDEDENSKTDFASVFLSREASHPENPYLEIKYTETPVESVTTTQESTGDTQTMKNLATWSAVGLPVITAALMLLGWVVLRKRKRARSLALDPAPDQFP